MTDSNLLSPWVRRFLLEYLITGRNLARSTQLSYRDTLAALIRYVVKTTGVRADLLKLEDFSRERIGQFLQQTQTRNKCGPRTANRHLAALHTFARFVAEYSPVQLQWSGTILSIAFKKFEQPEIPYLEKPEMDALLAAPDQKTPQGWRDHAVLLFAYNTGARASEIAHVLIGDLQLPASPDARSAFVALHGKGSKIRLCPLWPDTARVLKTLIAGRGGDQHVFINRCARPITRFGIHAVVERYAAQIAKKLPGLDAKRVSPHTIRHTSATHLLQAGVDINTIRAWLGHVSINTTNVYAQIDVKMKAKVLAELEPTVKSLSHRGGGSDLMLFLAAL